jgi:hypothetical protein
MPVRQQHVRNFKGVSNKSQHGIQKRVWGLLELAAELDASPPGVAVAHARVEIVVAVACGRKRARGKQRQRVNVENKPGIA